MKPQSHTHAGPGPHPGLEAVGHAVAGDPFWEGYLDGLSGGEVGPYSLHLAVFVEPYLGYVLDGTKTAESRFSTTRCAPFDRVRTGDALMLKRTGGPIVGLARVRTVWSYRIAPESWRTIRDTFAEALCAQAPEFWESRSGASYATLMMLDRVRAIDPVQWRNKDRRGWVVVVDGTQPSLF